VGWDKVQTEQPKSSEWDSGQGSGVVGMQLNSTD
jgi:hypothetical protein